MFEEDTGCCGMCGVDPIEHERVEIGVTVIDLCSECYDAFMAHSPETTQQQNEHPANS